MTCPLENVTLIHTALFVFTKDLTFISLNNFTALPECLMKTTTNKGLGPQSCKTLYILHNQRSTGKLKFNVNFHTSTI